jgi:hypothetical protein
VKSADGRLNRSDASAITTAAHTALVTATASMIGKERRAVMSSVNAGGLDAVQNELLQPTRNAR